MVDAALAVFSRAGPEGARVDAIARTAGMNKRLLYHYVGDKAALFEAVVQAALARLNPDGPAADDTDAWRVLCHAAATGQDLSALSRRFTGCSRLDVSERLLTSLFPELAATLAAQETRPATDAAPSAPPAGRAGTKPRIKLRPSVNPRERSGG